MRKHKWIYGLLAAVLITGSSPILPVYGSADYTEPQEIQIVSEEMQADASSGDVAQAETPQADTSQTDTSQSGEIQADVSNGAQQASDPGTNDTGSADEADEVDAKMEGNLSIESESSTDSSSSGESENASESENTETESESESETETESEVRKNDVHFQVDPGALVTVNDVDVTEDSKEARDASQAIDGTIVFSVTALEDYEITHVLVDGEMEARHNGATPDVPNDYIIEGILTDETVVMVETRTQIRQSADDGSGTVVTAVYSSDAFDEPVELRVVLLSNETQELAAETEGDLLVRRHTLRHDIGFYNAVGEEKEPLDGHEVQVTLAYTFLDDASNITDITVVHDGEDGVRENMAQASAPEGEAAQINFLTDAFSPFETILDEEILPDAEESADAEPVVLAVDYYDSFTISVGDPLRITGPNWRVFPWSSYSSYSWSIDKASVVSIENNSSNSKTVQLKALKAGEVIVTVECGLFERTEYYHILVEPKKKVTITNAITGNMGDRNQTFIYNYQETRDDGNSGISGTFTLGNGGKQELEIRKNSTLTITETDSGEYATSISVNGGTATQKTVYEGKIEKDTTIAFTNKLEKNINTGIWSDRTPYILTALSTLAALLISIVCAGQRKKRRLYEE